MKIRVKDFEEILVVGDYADFEPQIYAQTLENKKNYPYFLQYPSQPTQSPLAIACYGPSLKGTLEQIRKFPQVMSCSGAHDLLIQNGIIPTYHAECDWRAHKADVIKLGQDKIQYLIASSAHPELLKTVENFSPVLFNLDMEPYFKHPENEVVFRSLGSIGLQCITLAHFLGYRNITIFGMDCNFELDGERHSGIHTGWKESDKDVWVKVGNKIFRSSAPFVYYAKMFVEVVTAMPDLKITLAGEGLLQEYVKTRQSANRGLC